MNFLRSTEHKSHPFVGAFLLIFILTTALLAHQPGSFRWNDDEDYRPFIYQDKNGQPKGIFYDLMQEIFSRLHVPFQCQLYPWKRTQVYVHNGLADGMVTVPTQKRLETMVASDPLVTSGEKIFTQRDNPRLEQILQIKTIDGLKPFRVVEVVGAGWAKEHFKDLPHLIWAPKLSSALYMLANGRVDIYVMNEFSGVRMIRSMAQKPSPFQENFKKIIMAPHTLKQIHYTLLINKTSPWAGLIPKINTTLKAIKHDGTYDKILQKYLSLDTPYMRMR